MQQFHLQFAKFEISYIEKRKKPVPKNQVSSEMRYDNTFLSAQVESEHNPKSKKKKKKLEFIIKIIRMDAERLTKNYNFFSHFSSSFILESYHFTNNTE